MMEVDFSPINLISAEKQENILQTPCAESSREEMLHTIEQLQKENKQLNRRLNLLQKKIDTAELAAQNDKLIDDIRSIEQKKL
jgi:predicted nuclease with TOPRIM domain